MKDVTLFVQPVEGLPEADVPAGEHHLTNFLYIVYMVFFLVLKTQKIYCSGDSLQALDTTV